MIPDLNAPFKGTAPRDFCFQFPQAPDYTIRAVSNLFENLRLYSELKVHHWHLALTPLANGKNLQSEKFKLFFWDTFGLVS
jgi:hypothetical protein